MNHRFVQSYPSRGFCSSVCGLFCIPVAFSDQAGAYGTLSEVYMWGHFNPSSSIHIMTSWWILTICSAHKPFIQCLSTVGEVTFVWGTSWGFSHYNLNDLKHFSLKIKGDGRVVSHAVKVVKRYCPVEQQGDWNCPHNNTCLYLYQPLFVL